MVLVEHLLGVADVELVFAVLLPRQADQPLQVGADDAILGGGRRHLGQPVGLAVGLRQRLGAHAGRLDRLAQPLDLGGVLVALAKLFLDGAHLLAQQVLALILVDPGLDLGLDLLAELEHRQLAGQYLGQPLKLGAHAVERQHLLLFGHAAAEQQRHGQQVCQAPWVILVDQLGVQLLAGLGQQLQDLAGQPDQVAHQRLGRHVVLGLVGEEPHPRPEVWLGLDDLLDLEALDPLDRDAQSIVGQPQQPVDHRSRADLVEVLGGDVLGALLLVLQRHQADDLLVHHRLVDQPDRLLLPDRQRDHG